MAGRYEKLLSLEKNLYVAGSPVVIEAGALLKDNSNNTVLAQLKIKNISPNTIKALTVKIKPFDTVGEVIGDDIEYQYLDLNIGRNGSFGSKEPVTLANNKTRSCKVAVTNVVFSDNSTYNNDFVEWSSIPEQETINLDEVETEYLYATYHLDNKKKMIDHEDLWLCTCGCVNKNDEAECFNCHNSKEELLAIDYGQLHYDAYYNSAIKSMKKYTTNGFVNAIDLFTKIEGYQDSSNKIVRCRREILDIKKREEEEKKAKIRKIIAIVIAVILFFVLVSLCETAANSHDYKKANALMESGSYSEAYDIYQELGNFKKSEINVLTCQLHLRYDDDILEGDAYYFDDYIEEIQDYYLDSPEASTYLLYFHGVLSKNVKDAISYYQQAGDFFDAQDRMALLEKVVDYYGDYNLDKNSFTVSSGSIKYDITIKSAKLNECEIYTDGVVLNMNVKYKQLKTYSSGSTFSDDDCSRDLQVAMYFDGTIKEYDDLKYENGKFFGNFAKYDNDTPYYVGFTKK